jgi:hypothetical protein
VVGVGEAACCGRCQNLRLWVQRAVQARILCCQSRPDKGRSYAAPRQCVEITKGEPLISHAITVKRLACTATGCHPADLSQRLLQCTLNTVPPTKPCTVALHVCSTVKHVS